MSAPARGRRSRGLAIAGPPLLALWLAIAGPSAAHSLLLSSDPAAGSTLPTPPTSVILTFGEPPDAALARVRVLDTSGVDHVAGAAEVRQGDPATLRVLLGELADGVYTVSWRVVSSVDGHASAGTFAFGVGEAAVPSPPEEVSAGQAAGSGAGAAARWLLYLGVAAMLGSAFVGAFIHARPPRRVIRLAALGWAGAAAGTLAVVAVQWLDSGVDPARLLASSLGPGIVARAAVIAVAGAAVAMLMRADGTAPVPSRRARHGLVLVLAAAALVVEVATGHAAASGIPIAGIAVQSVHAVAAAAWIGGLAALLLAASGLPAEEKTAAVGRYSRWAGVLLAAVALSGVARAIDQVGSLEALVGTEFGRLVLAKSAGLLGLAGLGAFNRFVNVPAAARSLTGLRRAGGLEVAGGGVVLLLTAVLVGAVPPSAALPRPSQAEPVVATGHDFATSVRVTLEVSPGGAGFNRFVASVTDYDTGATVAARGLSLGFALASTTGVAGSTLALEASDGAYEATGGNLSVDGIWRVTALVELPDGAVEVPFVIATRIPSRAVTADASADPVLYTVALDGGESAQVYLDPGLAGANELHVTFFDTGGGALEVADVSVAVGGPTLPGALLAPRVFGPGHLVASFSDARVGPLQVEVVGTHPRGHTLHVAVVIEVAP